MYFVFTPAAVSIVLLGVLHLTEHIWFRYDERPMLVQLEEHRVSTLFIVAPNVHDAVSIDELYIHD